MSIREDGIPESAVRGELHASYVKAPRDARERCNVVLEIFSCAYAVWNETLRSKVVPDGGRYAERA